MVIVGMLIALFGVIMFFSGIFSATLAPFLIGVVALIIGALIGGSPHLHEMNQLREKFISIFKENNLKLEDSYISMDNNCGLSIDKENRKIYMINFSFINEKYDSHSLVIKNFDEIIEAKVLKNADTITSTSRGSQIGGAVVGGALLGGVGAIVGGLSGKTNSKEKIKSLKLELVINDLDNPIFQLEFIDPMTSISNQDDRFENITNELNKVYRTFTVILHQNNSEIS